MGIVRAKERGRDYYLEKAYGPMGKQIMALAKMEKKGNLEEGEELRNQLRKNSLKALSEVVSGVDVDLFRRTGDGVLLAQLYVAVHVMEEVKREKDQKELHYGMGSDWRGKTTEVFRQEQDWRFLEEANGKFGAEAVGLFNRLITDEGGSLGGVNESAT